MAEELYAQSVAWDFCGSRYQVSKQAVDEVEEQMLVFWYVYTTVTLFNNTKFHVADVRIRSVENNDLHLSAANTNKKECLPWARMAVTTGFIIFCYHCLLSGIMK